MSDERLVLAIMNGDEKALDKAINKYSKLMWKISHDVLTDASPQDLEECVADVFIYLWHNSDKFDPAKGSLKSWLSTIARSRAINRMKNISRNSHLSYNDNMIAEELEKEDSSFKIDDKMALIAAVRALGDLDREILVRRYCQDQTPNEIADELNISLKSVENRLYRTKNKLRKILVG